MNTPIAPATRKSHPVPLTSSTRWRLRFNELREPCPSEAARSAMTDDRSSNPARIAGVLQRIGTWLLVVPSVILGICVVELFGHLFLPSTWNSLTIYRYVHEIVFFDGPGAIFRNQ